jgi:nucleotide-binding universal stress UspA family protein
VVGVDGTGSNREPLGYAAWEAERRGLPLRLVHGYQVPTPCLTQLAPLSDDPMLLAAAWDRLREIAQAVHARRPQLPLTSSAVRASGGAALVLESAAAGLVVVGSPRHGGFAGSPQGSVAAQVVADARSPVLVVPRSEVVPAPIPALGPVLVGVDGSEDSQTALGFGFEEASARAVALVAVHVWSVSEPVCEMRKSAGPTSEPSSATR